jgi:hypothetical protein
MKKMKRVIFFVFAICFAMALVGCTPRTGKYNLADMTIDGQNYLDMIQAVNAMDEEICYLEIVDGKNAKLVTGVSTGDKSVNLLTYDSNYFYLVQDGSKIDYKYDFIAGTISFSYNEEGHNMEMTFKK